MNIHNVAFEFAAGKADQLPESNLPEIVFSGRSNVGKSSLINKIVNRKSIARVSSTPGKTATINFFKVDNFHLVDLPGYGYAKVSQSEKERWAKLVEGYFNQERNFCLVVQIIDMRHPPTKDDLHMLDFLHNNNFPFVVVLTKKDKLRKKQLEKRTKSLKEELKDYDSLELFPFSALNGEGTEEIRNVMLKYLNNANNIGQSMEG